MARRRRALLLASLALAIRRRRRRQEEERKPKRRFWVRQIFSEERKERGEWENLFVCSVKTIENIILRTFV